MRLSQKPEPILRKTIQTRNCLLQTYASILALAVPIFPLFLKTGLNYSRYITSLRLEQAAKLLTDTDDTALSIGYQVGYSAPNYFCRAFKKFYGISPSRYREEKRVPTA